MRCLRVFIAGLFRDLEGIRKPETRTETNWAALLGKVKTPLGLFSLFGLRTAGILLAVIARANQEILAIIAIGMIAVVLAEILAVSIIYHHKVK